MNRRTFVASGSVVALSIASGSVSAYGWRRLLRDASPGDGIALDGLVVDARFPASRSFGSAATRLGANIRSIDGDVTALWLNCLQPRWALGEGAIAGMTTRPALFCLEMLARDHRLRVLFRAEHQWQADGRVRHDVTAPAAALQAACAALANELLWPQLVVAFILSNSVSHAAARSRRSITTTARTPHDAVHTPLVSWVIA